MTALGIGLIGCGRFGTHLAETVARVEGARLVAVTDVDAATAAAVAARFQVRSCGGVGELLADPRVQAVIVATPHASHEAVVVAAAEAGKHIFCEKPMAIDVDAAQRMMAAAAASGIRLMVGQVVRLYPLFRRVASLVHAGQLGRIVMFTFEGLYHIPRRGWWAKSETMGALLHSPGVHDLDFMRLICGEARNVYARESSLRIQPGVEYQDAVCVSIEYASGAIGQLASSVSNLVPCRRGTILGTAGSLTFDARAGRIEYARTDSWSDESAARTRQRLDLSTTDDDDGVRAELRSFVRWVTRDEPPLVTAEDGLRAVELIDAAYRSIRLGRSVALPLTTATTA